MTEIDERDVLDGNALKYLYTWIDAVPLTRTKKNIARDFSDGVLLAEIIHHYLPRAVEMHNYVVASSTGQKKINWNTLNRKVFSKLNIKLNETTLNQVVDAKPGAIEQILWDLRRKILEHASVDSKRDLLFTESKVGFSTGKVGQPRPSSSKAITSTDSKSRVQSFKPREVPLGSKRSSHHAPLNNTSSTKTIPESYHSASGMFQKSQTGINETNKTTASSPNDRQQYPGDSQTSFNTTEDLGSLPYSHIVFRGHKMVAVELLDAKDKEIKELENTNRQLNIKLDRLENLVNLKDSRIADLAHQVQNIRTMYEQVTQTPFDKLEKANQEMTGE